MQKELITDTLILSRTTEYDIYAYYIGHRFIIGSKFNSPLRRDANPSFGIFVSKKTNSLLFKDQSTGEVGNCFKFVQLKEHLPDFKSTLNRIYEDLNLNNLRTTEYGIKVRDTYKASTTKIEIKRKYYTNSDDLYWNKYSIDRSILKHFNVYPIQHAWINDKLLSWKYSETEPMYAYQIYNKFKIYRPLSKTSEKWLSNCTINDVQGFEQLPLKGDLLLITKSLKDVMCLYKLGYNAISANSENTLIPQKIITNIKSRFNKIIVFYDNDEAGIKGSDNMCNTYDLKSISIDISLEVKDVSDYIKKYNLSKASKLIKKLIYDLPI